MGWRLRVVHTTQVSYTAPVRASFNEVRMTPLTLPTQVTLESRVSAGPGVPVWTYADYWGTFVSVFDITEPHESLAVRAQATVETGQALGDPPSVLLSAARIPNHATRITARPRKRFVPSVRNRSPSRVRRSSVAAVMLANGSMPAIGSPR